MFQSAGIDALSGLALLYATVLIGLTNTLVHLVWQVALRTKRFEWRGAVVSSAILIGVLSGVLLATGGIESWAGARLFFVLATVSLLGGALLGRFLGWIARLVLNKSSGRAYR
jgi:hypothetical protein